MSFQIQYHPIPNLPKLGWLCALSLKSRILSVFHGSSVECNADWMVEGIWNDEFESGNFHRSEDFFGSGIRIDGNRVYFVPSSALVDRLFYCLQGDNLLVSNSLIFLLAFTGAKLDLEHDYHNEIQTMTKGIKEYSKDFIVAHKEISQFYQVFYENMIVAENGDIKFEFRGCPREIGSFEEYFSRITNSLARMKLNYESKGRKFPMTAFVTLSTGYDSTAVASLVKDIGVRRCFSTRRSNSRLPVWMNPSRTLDDGRSAATALGLDIIYSDAREVSNTEDEIYFLAASPERPELRLHTMVKYIEKNHAAAVVFTGYHGGRIWGLDSREKYMNDEIKRLDVSTLGLSVIRLKSGFINAAVPFLEARNIKSLVQISCSEEMKPWRLNTSYDRPIPRRIAETAGVDRSAFGMRKRAIIQHYEFPVNRDLQKNFLKFLEKNYDWSPARAYFHAVYDQLRYRWIRALRFVGDSLNLPRAFRPRLVDKNLSEGGKLRLHYLMHLWSVLLLSEKMADVFRLHFVGASKSTSKDIA